MIKLSCQKNDSGNYISFQAKGHAGYAKAGEPDIICASITSLAATLIGSLEDILGLKLERKLIDGLIEAKIISISPDREIAGKVDLLFTSFILGCKQIELSYGSKYIKVL